MLLGERTRRDDDKQVVKEVIEREMRVKIDENVIYSVRNPSIDYLAYLGVAIPSSPQVVWSSAMQRLFVLVARALQSNEPVLLVGETGSGKTSVCQIYADAVAKRLYSLSCHQNTETADLIGGLRPVRNRTALKTEVLRDVSTILRDARISYSFLDETALLSSIERQLKHVSGETRAVLEECRGRIMRLNAIFEWRDGPLVEAMRHGDVFLLDEISLADDSVLERLNSVLEPSRTIVLAERGGDDIDHADVRALDSFKIIATMNPGGDYGKKELSPALRNRFTEIWVPPVHERGDLELIIASSWEHPAFHPYTSRILDFVDWLVDQIGDRSVLSLRDLLVRVLSFPMTATHNLARVGLTSRILYLVKWC
jgi:midasin